MNGLYGRPYGTLLANVENLLPAAQGGGLAPLLPSRFTGESRWAKAATLVTPPAPASPTVAFPGQPQYGIQQSPNYGPVIGYGTAEGGSAVSTVIGASWRGSGGYSYNLYTTGQIVIVTPAKYATVTLTPGTKGYQAILDEASRLQTANFSDYNRKSINFWLAKAKSMAETRPFPYPQGASSSSSSAEASAIAAGEPPVDLAPPSGMPTGLKVAIGVLAVSAVIGGVLIYRRRKGRKA